MIFLVFLIYLSSVLGQSCDRGWTAKNGVCYKYYNDISRRMSFGEMEVVCAAQGAVMADGISQEELEYLHSLTWRSEVTPDVTRINKGETEAARMICLSVKAKDYNAGIWVTSLNETVNPRWCAGEPNYGHTRTHITERNNVPCIGNAPFSYPVWGYFRFFCKKCSSGSREPKSTGCACKNDFVDMADIDSQYRGGERCVTEIPCQSVRSRMSILFIVDSSLSIGKSDWKSLTTFLGTGASLIPNNIRVGFIKYSYNVSYSRWLDRGWTQSEFERRLPSKYDEGTTNTAAALEKAVEMFQKDDSQKQVAVLVTDGLPYTDEYENKDQALSVTSNSAKKLLNSYAYLIALGYGKELENADGDSFLQSIVDDPKEDYMKFSKQACDLKKIHMNILLRKVCRRFE